MANASSRFPFGRVPLESAAEETARTEAYWAWLHEHWPRILDTSQIVDDLGAGVVWVSIGDEAAADFEAHFMRHSIGHSWGRYSGLGSIYSLRSAGNIPEATVLIREIDGQNIIVHAREHENARLSAQNDRELSKFASRHGFKIVPDQGSFDVFLSDHAPNTRIKYFQRDADNRKSFHTVIIAGRIDQEQVAQIAASIGDDATFVPSEFGLPHPFAPTACQMLSIVHVYDEPSIAEPINEICAGWTSDRPRPLSA